MSRRAAGMHVAAKDAGSLPLLAVGREPQQRQPTFLSAAFEARRALGAAAGDADARDAGERMLVQLQGLAECLGDIAATGLLHLDATPSTLRTTSRRVDGAWRSTTRATRAPPAACLHAPLPAALCATLMQSLVVLDACAVDDGELVELRALAGVLVDGWEESVGAAACDETRAFAERVRAAWPATAAAVGENGAPSSPSPPSSPCAHARLARATSDRLHAAARAAGGTGAAAPNGGAEACDSALELARRTLRRVAGR